MDFKIEHTKDYNDWINKFNEARAYMLNRKNNKVLIECAAQHPLRDGQFPGEEFQKRLDLAISLYKENKKQNKEVKIYVPGSRHMMNGIKDKVSLSMCGKNYLIKNGIPAKDVYSVSFNKKYKGLLGVYNSADECYVASKIFKDEEFDKLISVVSPAQMYRKTLFYIQFGVIPLNYSAPTENMFHNYIDELCGSIPKVLTKDKTWQADDSEFAINSRNQRCVYLNKPLKKLSDMSIEIINKNEYLIEEKELMLDKQLDLSM